MIELVIGILIGIILLPILICLYPTLSKISKRSTTTNFNFKKHLSESQAKVVLKSLNKCTDLNWLNVFLDRFWMELSESSAQAYRLKNYIKKSLQDLPGTGFIRSIEVLDIDIGQEGPQIESIRIISEDEIENLVKSVLNKEIDISSPEEFIKSEIDKDSDFNVNFYKENGKIDCYKVYKDLFTNVHSIISIIFTGSIKIKLQVDFPKNITLYTNVCIKKIKGDILTRFPSLNYNTRLEYTFIGNPDMEIDIEAGVGKGQNEGYFKKSISNFIRRTIKYTILKSFVYPSFNTLYLPLLVSSFKNAEHSISVISNEKNTDTIKNMEKVKESLSLYMDMDYKILETYNDITIRRNNFLINEKERIYCAHFMIPECALKSSHFTTNKNFIYEKLTIKESKIMNHIYDLSILKDVISSYKETTTIQNYNSTYSLIDIKFIEKSYTFIRLVHNDTIYFQKNDKENPEFFIFTIRNKELFIYYFINTQSFLLNKNRLIKLKNKLDMKPGKKISFNKLYKYSRNALLFWKNNSNNDPRKSQVTDVKNIVEDIEYPNFLEEIENILQEPIQQQKTFSYKFKCRSNIIFDILLQDDVRVKLVSDQSKIFRFLSENELLKSFAVENKDENGGDFVMHTFNKSNIIVDFIDKKKIIYELIEETNENFPELYVDTRIQNPLYKIPSISETHIQNCDKNKKIVFKNQNFNEIRQVKLKSNFQRIIEKYETKLNIYVEEGIIHTKDNHLYESVYTRITKQEIINIVNKSDFEKLDLKKELRKDFFGDIGGVYIEFKTEISDDFKFLLYSTSQKRNILEIHKVISSRPFKMIIPIYEEDILLLKLVPKYQNNKSIKIKVVNLPIQYHKETMIDCNIGLKKNESFLYPIIGSPNYIIYWEKEKEDFIQGSLESPYTKVDICGNGTMRTDQMSYTMTYKNKGQKCRELKIYIGVTKKE